MHTSIANKIIFLFLSLILIAVLSLTFIFIYQSRGLSVEGGYDAFLETVLYGFLIITVIIVMITIILGRFLVSKISRPLEKLIMQTEKLSGGNYDVWIDIKTNDEIEVLANSFNEMARTVADYTSQLKEQKKALEAVFESLPGRLLIIDVNYGIQMANKKGACFYSEDESQIPQSLDGVLGQKCHKIYGNQNQPCAGCPVKNTKENGGVNFSEMTFGQDIYHLRTSPLPQEGSENGKVIVYCIKATEQVLIEKEILQMEKLAVMGQLAAGITHELKNPMAVLKAGVYYLDQLKKKKEIPRYILNREMENTLSNMKESLDRAEASVYNILDFSKPNHMKREPIYLDRIVQQVLLLFSKELIKCRIKVEINMKEDEYIGNYDPNVIKNILISLISNAMHAMPEGGWLGIDVFREKGKDIEIRVSDSGIGIAADKRDEIFKPFYTTKKDKGTGLGLWIVKKQVEKVNGKIRMACRGESGTSFSIMLPEVMREEDERQD